jgi:type IV secretion system protein VirB5
MKLLFRSAVTLVVALAANGPQAQGIPVIDVANLIQTIQQVLNDVTKIENQVEQINQLRTQLNSITGARGLGTVLNSAALHDYVPANAFTVVNAIDAGGYAGLSATAKVLRDAGMVYNCANLTGAQRTGCQAELAQPYQQKGLLQDAMHSAAGRMAQITNLMAQINTTSDQKGVLEIQARIGAENAMLTHELSQIQMLQGMADSEERIARSRDRERQYEMLSRTGRIADYLR